jgi:molecular chaperone HtpG
VAGSPAEAPLVSLDDYCSRAGEDQKQIYFVTGTDARSILKDPNLEIFRSKNLEVLVLTDPVDEYVLSNLGTYQEREIVSVDSSAVKLPDQKDADNPAKEDADKPADAETPGGFESLLKLFREALQDQVQEVKRSERLTESDCCLVSAQGSMSTTMQRVLRMNTPEFEMAKMILEINPKSSLIRRLSEIAENPTNADFIRDCGRQLHANAMIMAGLAPDGNEMASRLQNFMLQLAQQRTSIII